MWNSVVGHLGIGAATVLAAVSWSGAALAEVRLSTAVDLVESIIRADGRTQRQLVDATLVGPGDELRYTITFTNTGLVGVDADAVVITNAVPDSTAFVQGSAGGAGAQILFSVDGGETFAPFEVLALNEGGVERPVAAAEVQAIRWVYGRRLAPGAFSKVWFHVRMEQPPASTHGEIAVEKLGVPSPSHDRLRP